MTDVIQYLEWTVSGGFCRWFGSVFIFVAIGSAITASLSTGLTTVSLAIRNAFSK